MKEYVDMHRVEKIMFSMLSPEEIEKMAVLKITSDKSHNSLGHIVENGIFDLRLGPIMSSTRGFENCKTCGYTVLDCKGHLGVIDLPLKVYNPLFFDIIALLIKQTCVWCWGIDIKDKCTSALIYERKLLEEGYFLSSLDVRSIVKNEHLQIDEAVEGDPEDEKSMSQMEMQTKARKFYKHVKKSTETCPVVTTLTNVIQEELLAKFKDLLSTKQYCTVCRKPKLQVKFVYSQLQIHNLNDLEFDDDSILHSNQNYITAEQACLMLRKCWVHNKDILKTFYPFLKRNDMEYPTDLLFFSKIPVIPPRFRSFIELSKQIVNVGLSTLYMNLVRCSKAITLLGHVNKSEVENISDELKTALRNLEPVNGTFEEKLYTLWRELQDSVTNIFDANAVYDNKLTAKKGVKQILEKKQGLVRQCLMGKRVNYSARSVAAPDPKLNVDEVGVPKDFALKLTYPVPVTNWNVGHLRQLVINGAYEYPGAVKIILDDGRVVNLAALSKPQRIAHANRLLTKSSLGGSKNRKRKIVLRHMQDGDFVLINRQPTLHRPSIQSHKVRLMEKDKVLRMPYANCKAYNADFDGDELNLHFPQGEKARAEASKIVTTHRQYLTVKDGTPLAGLIQDCVVAGVKLTIRGRFFNKEDYNRLVNVALYDTYKPIQLLPPAILKPYQMWSGKQVISTILQNILPENCPKPTFNFKTQVKVELWQTSEPKSNPWIGNGIPESYKESMTESDFVMRSGELLCGVIDKCSIGSVSHGLVHVFYDLYGGEIAAKVLTSMNRVTLGYLSLMAHTISTHEFVTEPLMEIERSKRAKEIVKNCSKEVVQALSITEEELPVHLEMAHASGNAKAMESIERAYSNVLGPPTSQLTKDNELKLCRTTLDNNMRMMVETGAKGTKINMNQIVSLFGSVALDGKRIPMAISGKSLPCFTPYDTNPVCGGYIPERYMTGMKTPSFFFLGVVGRDSLQHTAVKTASSGYMQRCLIKHLEGISVSYDRTVRNSDGLILQFQYGEDGQDVEKMPFLSTHKSVDVIADNYSEVHSAQLKKISHCNEKVEKAIQKYKKKAKKVDKICGDKTRNSGFLNFCKSHKFDEDDSEINKKYGRSERSITLVNMWRSLSNEEKESYNSLVPPKKYDPVSTKFSSHSHPSVVSEQMEDFVESYYDYYSNKPKWLAVKTKEEVRQAVFAKNLASRVEPGEDVGALCAQAIGEPLTQMTLNTFHFAGRDELNVTLGVPRMIELLRTGSKNIKTPIMEIPFLPRITQAVADKVGQQLSAVDLCKLLTAVDIDVHIVEDGGKLHNKVKLKFNFLHEKRCKKLFMVNHKDLCTYFEKVFIKDLVRGITKAIKLTDVSSELSVVKNTNKSTEKQIYEDDDDNDGGGGEEAVKQEEKEEDDGDAEPEELDGVSNVKSEGVDYSEDESDDSDDENPNMKTEIDEEAQEDTENNHSQSTKDNVRSSKANGLSNIRVREENIMNFSRLIDQYSCDEKKFKWCELILKIPVVSGLQDVSSFLCNRIRKAQIRAHNLKKVCVAQKDNTLVLRTEGVDFMAVRAYENVLDMNRLYTNNIGLICESYGIEAAQRSIIKEIRAVQAAYNIKVDFRHLSLLADYFTCEGTYKACSRHAMKACPSVVQSMTFETLFNVLKHSLVNKKADPVSSPSSNILVGNVIPMGTNAMDILLDQSHSTKKSF